MLEQLLERSDALPLGNRAALARIAALCDEPSATAEGVALEAARDEGFAALLMKIANSAHSGSVRRISELRTAVTRLGFRLVQGLAVAAPGLRLLTGPNDGLGPARLELHRHAVRAGLAARSLAPAGVDPEHALTAGLLQNIGLNVVSLLEPASFGLLLDAGRSGYAFRDVELGLLGCTHAQLGAELARRWSYPPALCGAILEHDSEMPQTPLAAVVHVADRLVRNAGIGVEPKFDASPAALALAGVDDFASAVQRLQFLLDAQERFDAHMDHVTPAPAGLPAGFAEAIEQLR